MIVLVPAATAINVAITVDVASLVTRHIGLPQFVEQRGLSPNIPRYVIKKKKVTAEPIVVTNEGTPWCVA